MPQSKDESVSDSHQQLAQAAMSLIAFNHDYTIDNETARVNRQLILSTYSTTEIAAGLASALAALLIGEAQHAGISLTEQIERSRAVIDAVWSSADKNE